MQELILRLTEKAGISAEQANKVVITIKDFVIEKFPMMAGAVDNLFASGTDTTNTYTPGSTTARLDPTAPIVEEPGFLDKISDVIPGQTGEKVETFVKGAADKAEDAYDAVKEKLSDMFNNKK